MASPRVHGGDRLSNAVGRERAALAYLLVPEVVYLHPVSVWQSKEARYLIVEKKLLGPTSPIQARLLVSRPELVSTYLFDRIPHLESLRAVNPSADTELAYYAGFEDGQLREDCAFLDDTFVNQNGATVASWNKPLTHRRLITKQSSCGRLVRLMLRSTMNSPTKRRRSWEGVRDGVLRRVESTELLGESRVAKLSFIRYAANIYSTFKGVT